MSTYVNPVLVDAWNQVVTDAKKVGIDYDTITKVTFDRATRRLGCCHWDEQTKTYSITLSPNLKPERYPFVLMHELCHAKNGVHGHGTKWKARAAKANKLGYEIERCGSSEEMQEKPKYKYQISCTSCCKSFYRLRESKCVTHPEEYCCGNCGGKLEVKELF